MESAFRAIRDQMKSDFKTIMLAFDVQRKAIDAALAAQQELVAGFMERTEQRLDHALALMEGMESWRRTVDSRLDNLEKKQAG